MRKCVIGIPAEWLGMGDRCVEAIKIRLPQCVSESKPLELLERWKAKGSSLRKGDRRVRSAAEKVSLEIMIYENEYQWLESTGATVLRSPEDILAAMAGELVRSFATWEKVEAARNETPGGDAGKATLPQDIRRNPILAGDKVLFGGEFGRNTEFPQFTTRPWWPAGVVHSVRKISSHPVTGEPVVHLVGCYGVSTESKHEPGFPPDYFRKISESRGVSPVLPDDLIEVPVEVTGRIVRQLESFALFPQVEEIHKWETDEQLISVCRRWETCWRMSKNMRDASATVWEEIGTAGSETQVVTMSGLGWQNLDSVCKRLEITPEAWLQGVLFNLASRCQIMRASYECRLRNDHKKKR